MGSINLTYHRCAVQVNYYVSVGCMEYNRFYGFPLESQHCTYNISIVGINYYRASVIEGGRLKILMCIGVGPSLPR